MKLLVITNIYPPQELGGYGRCISDFVTSLITLNHVVDVLTSDQPYLLSSSNNCSEYPSSSSITITRSLKLKGSYEKGVSVFTSADICQSIDRFNIDIIHSFLQSSYDGILLGNIDLLGPELIPFLLRFDIPVLHHVGFVNPPYNPKYQPDSSLYILCPASHAVKDSLRSHGFRVADSSVIYPGVNNSFFTVSPLNVSPALSYSLSIHSDVRPIGSISNPINLGYAGLIMQSKGLHTIIESLIYLRDSNIFFNLSIAGSVFQKSYFNQIKSFLISSNLDKYVRFFGSLTRPQLSRFWNLQHIGIFPSIHPEAFGIVAAEIMSSGLTLLSTGVGGASELFKDGDSGFFFDAGNAYDLASKIRALVDSPPLLQSVSCKARVHASSNLDISNSALILDRLFRSFN